MPSTRRCWLLLALIFGLPAQAQVMPLSGKVVDAETGQSLGGANVVYYAIAYEGSWHGRGPYDSTIFLAETVSGADGSFAFPLQNAQLPWLGWLKEYEPPVLHVFKDGYESEQLTDPADRAGDATTRLDIWTWLGPLRPIALRRTPEPASMARFQFDVLRELGPCDWEKLPRYLEAAGAQALRLESAGDSERAFRAGPATSYEQLVENDGQPGNAQCASFRSFALEHFPQLRLPRAMQRGDAEMVRAALAAGVDPNTQLRGQSLLVMAARGKHREILKALLEQPRLRISPAEQAEVFRSAAPPRRTDILDAILARGIDVNGRDELGATPLMHCAEAGLDAQVRALIARGADVNAANAAGTNVLSRAMQPYRRGIVKLLLDAGATPAARTGGHPAMARARFDDTQLVRDLLDAGLLAGDDARRGLMMAANNGDASLATALVEYLPTLYTDADRSKALVYAAQWKQWNVVEALMPAVSRLERAQRQALYGLADDEMRRKLAAWPPMQQLAPEDYADVFVAASRAGNWAEVDRLRALGIDVDVRDSSGGTALIAAAGTGRLDLVKGLLARGAMARRTSSKGVTALMAAADHGVHDRPHPFVTTDMRQYEAPEVLELLLKAGSDPNAQAHDGWTALMRARALHFEDSAAVLLKRGARRGLRNRQGQTAAELVGASTLEGVRGAAQTDAIRPR